jgi:hypothetical protein
MLRSAVNRSLGKPCDRKVPDVRDEPRKIRDCALYRRRMIRIARKRLSECLSKALWRLRVILAVGALAVAGCNANQAINSSVLADRCANDADCNPYDPSSYAQNNTGIGR